MPSFRAAALLALSTASCNAVLGIDHDYTTAPTASQAPAGAGGTSGGGVGGSSGGEGAASGAADGGASGATAGVGGASGTSGIGGSSGESGSGGTSGAGGGSGVAGTSVVAIATGDFHTCALRADGTTWCWGDDSFGQIGLPPDDVPHPKPTFFASGASHVAVGGSGTCIFGLANGGTLCSGYDLDGELAVPIDQSVSAQPAMTPAGLETLSLGGYFSCGIASGAVWCWGDDQWGELGSATAQMGPDPVRIDAIPSPIAIATSGNFACALSSDGSVWCWGSELDGQLGNGVQAQGSITFAPPAKVEGSPPAKAIATGDDHVCAITDSPVEGSVFCWGDDEAWQCGTSGGSVQLAPVQAIDVSGAVELAAGSSHTCALTKTGTVTCWGDNAKGQLGLGGVGTMASAKVVPGIVGATAIVASANHTCVLASGAVSCWGENERGELGDGTTIDRPAPVPVAW